jgi:uncharacterized protein YjbI with pentapeptide repeats
MQFTQEELDKILENHKHWLNRDCDGWENMKADLRGANLRGADLYKANLLGANLRGADLYKANLYGANLRGANLTRADLSGANLNEAKLNYADLCSADLSEAELYRADLRAASLYRANLSRANLSGANLLGANLCEANLTGADLSGANLRGANLCGADLSEVELREANLRGADLYKANLLGANLLGADLYDVDLSGANLNEARLRGAKNIPYIPTVCPDTGSFTGWKKAWVPREGSSNDEKVICIVQLEIPEDARRSSATTRKCRCDKALVKSIEILDEGVLCTKAYSYNNPEFVYEEGKVVSVDDFDEDRFNECSTGIHFFVNRQEAIDYIF